METIGHKIEFFIKALLSGGQAGAIATSSEYVVEGVLKHVHGPIQTIIEYGPGDGVMTRAILKFLAPDGKIVVIESEASFIETLQQIGDPRIQIIEGYVQDVINSEKWDIKEADLILSSIPFSFLSPAERDKVIEISHNLLKTQGSFIVFHQYSTLIKKTVERYFGEITVSFEPRNVFPCFILFAKKI